MSELITMAEIETMLNVRAGYIQRMRVHLTKISNFPEPNNKNKIGHYMTYSKSDILKWSKTHDINSELKKCYKEKNNSYKWNRPEIATKTDYFFDFIAGKIGMVNRRENK